MCPFPCNSSIRCHWFLLCRSFLQKKDAFLSICRSPPRILLNQLKYCTASTLGLILRFIEKPQHLEWLVLWGFLMPSGEVDIFKEKSWIFILYRFSRLLYNSVVWSVLVSWDPVLVESSKPPDETVVVMCGTKHWILLFFQNWTSQENTGLSFSAIGFELSGRKWSSLWQHFEAHCPR